MAQISKKSAKSLPLKHYPHCAQGSDLSPIFGDLSQSEKKKSEIKTPLVLFKCRTGQLGTSFIRKGIENSKTYFESKSQVGFSTIIFIIYILDISGKPTHPS